VQQGLAFRAFEVGLQQLDTCMQLRVSLRAVVQHGVGASLVCGGHRFQLGALRAHLMAAQQRAGARQVQCQTQYTDTLQRQAGGG